LFERDLCKFSFGSVMILSNQKAAKEFQCTVGAISLERREKFRAQIQSLLLSFIVKLESCALEQLYRDTCWGGDDFSPS
jgi:hypothetical protein